MRHNLYMLTLLIITIIITKICFKKMSLFTHTFNHVIEAIYIQQLIYIFKKKKKSIQQNWALLMHILINIISAKYLQLM